MRVAIFTILIPLCPCARYSRSRIYFFTNKHTRAQHRYWGAFARDHAPEAEGAVLWPPHNASTDELLLLQTGGSVAERDPAHDYCDFWDELGYFFN